MAWPAPSHYLNQCWIIVNWTLRNKLLWNSNRNSNIFIQENAFESDVCETVAILSRPQCVNASHQMSSLDQSYWSIIDMINVCEVTGKYICTKSDNFGGTLWRAPKSTCSAGDQNYMRQRAHSDGLVQDCSNCCCTGLLLHWSCCSLALSHRFEAPRDFLRSDHVFWLASSGWKLHKINSQRNCEQSMFNFVNNTVSADGLAPLGARPSADTMMRTRSGFQE